MAKKRARDDAASDPAVEGREGREKKKKKKTKKKKKKTKEETEEKTTTEEAAAAPAAPSLSDLSALEASLRAGEGGSLSDRLNPDHPAYDPALKARWKGLGKKGRAALVEADRGRHASAKLAGERNLASLPFAAAADDHCESPPEAYADVAAVLDLVAKKLGKDRSSLAIYDPYYCAGAMKAHLAALGFSNVRNDNVDFYEAQKAGALPPHDVLVTNPPYSGDHVGRLLDFCRRHAGTPYLLLMPNYVAAKADFADRLRGADGERPAPFYVCPRKRYCYWTPKAMRAKDKQQGHVSALGHRTSPFASFWYVDLSPHYDRDSVLRRPPATGPRAPLFCGTLGDLPAACRPS